MRGCAAEDRLAEKLANQLALVSAIDAQAEDQARLELLGVPW
jgi:hypothetical protein